MKHKRIRQWEITRNMNPKETLQKLQVLCANCNWIKLTKERQRGFNNG